MIFYSLFPPSRNLLKLPLETTNEGGVVVWILPCGLRVTAKIS